MEVIPVSPGTLKQLLDKDKKLLKALEKEAVVEIQVNAKDATVEVVGEGGGEWVVLQVLKAMDFGFLPQRAFKLFNDNYFIEVLDLALLVRTEKAIKRYKGRIIGAQGQAKKNLEELSDTFIAVSGNHVAIIGGFEDLRDAKEAITMLLEGATHNSVFAFLERRNKQKRMIR